MPDIDTDTDQIYGNLHRCLSRFSVTASRHYPTLSISVSFSAYVSILASVNTPVVRIDHNHEQKRRDAYFFPIFSDIVHQSQLVKALD